MLDFQQDTEMLVAEFQENFNDGKCRFIDILVHHIGFKQFDINRMSFRC